MFLTYVAPSIPPNNGDARQRINDVNFCTFGPFEKCLIRFNKPVLNKAEL